MAAKCNDNDLLIYSGTSQQQRILITLLARYAEVDERTASQLILFAKKYGAYLNYFDGTNQPAGDWQHFMAKDVSVTIATVTDWRIRDLMPFIKYVNEEVHNAVTAEEAKKYFKTIFDLVFSLASLLDQCLKRLPNDVRFTTFLSVAISSNLAVPLSILSGYYNTFKWATLSLISENSMYIDLLMPVDPVLLSGSFDISSLEKAWQVSYPAPPEITLKSLDAKDDISHILTHNLFNGPLQLFINGIINIVSKAPAYLNETLFKYSSHEPHYALYLAFLRLFKMAQDHLNDFTHNHLDFYYKDVLQLRNRVASPAFVHLIFELQKNTGQYLLTSNTSFKAGKDNSNNDLHYALANDVVIQKASIQSLQSLYLDKAAGILVESTVANSADGSGGKLTSTDQSWFAFGNDRKTPLADNGFAIASNVLYLNEGRRNINVTFNCSNLSGVTEDDLKGVFRIRFTTKKNWYTATSYSVVVNSPFVTFTVILPGDVPGIVAYSKKIHEGNFDTVLPMAQALVTDYKSYLKIKGLNVVSIILSVSATVKNLSLQNNDGKINAAKPFKPFGEFPGKNSSLIIGSKEIFQKHLTKLDIVFDWQPVDTSVAEAVASVPDYEKINLGPVLLAFSAAFPADTISSTATQLSQDLTASSALSATDGIFSNEIAASDVLSIYDVVNATLPVAADLLALSEGGWSKPIASSKNLYNTPVSLSKADTGNIPVTDSDFTPDAQYGIDAVSGYIKLALQTDTYSLATYLGNIQTSLEQTSVTVNYENATSLKVTSYTVPKPKLALPSPQIEANSVIINYSAETTIDFKNTTDAAFIHREGLYYHLEPFGSRELHPGLTDDAITFLPVFNLDNGVAKDNGGELWIGLKDASADETLSILFQVSDGSSNPLKPMTKIQWYYLAFNNWLPFDKLSVTDDTNSLTRSGIVTVSLPGTAKIGNTRANIALTWIKLVADHDPDAVSKIIAIRNNAAKAEFVQHLSRGIEFTKVLPAATISKPEVPVAAIKKTEQPYTSFGGRLHETNDQFYVRVSERLRHKHRAVAAWDYERLVLDYFPKIHKAKCISHTGFIENDTTKELSYSEVLPGHVMVVTVPDLTTFAAANLLRPYTSVGLLEEMQQYLEKLTSPFVRLHVTNPQFEEVQFDFKVTFLPGHDLIFFKKQLGNDIEKFLTPWAYESGRDIEFGGKIEKSVVLNFVEERPYVDFVTCFKMNHIVRREGSNIRQALYNVEEAVASTARSILVSYYNEDDLAKHIIQSPANCKCDG